MNTSRLLRHINAIRCLKLLRSGRVVSRAEIARELGLTRSTVGNAIRELLDAGLVAEADWGESELEARKGRPGVGVSLAPAGAFAIGLNVGTRALTCVLVNLRMEIVGRHEIATGPNFRDPEAMFDKLADLPRRALARTGLPIGKVKGLCVAIPGLVSRDGQVVNAPFLEWRGFPLARRLASRFDPGWIIAVRNDAVCFAAAERAASVNSDAENLLVVLLDEGVGSSLVTSGEAQEGAHGYAGEIGHTQIADRGGSAPFEALAGATAFSEFLRPDRSVGESVAMLRDAKDDPEVARALRVWGDNLARGFANAIHLIDPGRVVLGGPLATLFPLVQEQVEARLRAELLTGFAPPQISVTRFASDGAALGAAALVRETIFALPEIEPARGEATTDTLRGPPEPVRERPLVRP